MTTGDGHVLGVHTTVGNLSVVGGQCFNGMNKVSSQSQLLLRRVQYPHNATCVRHDARLQKYNVFQGSSKKMKHDCVLQMIKGRKISVIRWS